jgi:hypothetical protein
MHCCHVATIGRNGDSLTFPTLASPIEKVDSGLASNMNILRADLQLIANSRNHKNFETAERGRSNAYLESCVPVVPNILERRYP